MAKKEKKEKKKKDKKKKDKKKKGDKGDDKREKHAEAYRLSLAVCGHPAAVEMFMRQVNEPPVLCFYTPL